VLPHHTQDLHNAWAGERLLRVFEGGHNGVRPAWFLEEASDFLVERLGKAGPGSTMQKQPIGHRIGPPGSGARGDFEDDGPPECPESPTSPEPQGKAKASSTKFSLDTPPTASKYPTTVPADADRKLHQLRRMPSNFVWNHFIPSSFLSLCWKPTLPFLNLRFLTRDPGRDR